MSFNIKPILFIIDYQKSIIITDGYQEPIENFFLVLNYILPPLVS